MTLESLARTIAKARHGTDAMWPNFMGAAEAVVREYPMILAQPIEVTKEQADLTHEAEVRRRALIAHPNGQ